MRKWILAFVLQQISYLPERTEGVVFSESYYDVNQALVSVQGSPIADATSLEELKDGTLGAPIGTEPQLHRGQHPAEYAAGRLRRPRRSDPGPEERTGRRDRGGPAQRVLHQRGADPQGRDRRPVPDLGSHEYFAMAFEKGSPLVQCINLALQEMKDDGTLDEIRQEWLADEADAPVIEGLPRPMRLSA